MRNYYHILGIDRAATSDEIKVAYRKLALKFHPDMNGNDVFFDEKFRQIKDAYETLSDPYRKGRYDHEYDIFFSEERFTARNDSSKDQGDDYSGFQFDPEIEKRERYRQKEEYRKAQERKETRDIRRKAELTFEDRAWIGIGSALSLGLLGVIMAIKYYAEGYHLKAKQSVIVTIIGFVAIFVFTLISVGIKSGNGY